MHEAGVGFIYGDPSELVAELRGKVEPVGLQLRAESPGELGRSISDVALAPPIASVGLVVVSSGGKLALLGIPEPVELLAILVYPHLAHVVRSVK